MRLNLYLLIFILLSLLWAKEARATHIVGGEMTYRCLGNNRYQIAVTVFRDCDTGVPWFDAPASIGVFDVNGLLVYDLRLRLRGNDTLDLDLTDSCYVAPPNICIHRTTYLDTITLPFRAGGYQLVYQRCCRNQDIVNIIDPLGTGATYTQWLTEAAMLSCNSSPVFRDWPPVYLCVDVPIVFDHSAIDTDGDSLVYELYMPFEGASPFNPQPQPPLNPPYNNVNWANGFGTNNMLGGTAALQINPQTGLLTGTPTQFGVFVVGIQVKEYRNGVLISTVQRDFQYAIGQCGRRNNAAFFSPEIVCDNSLLVRFQNSSQTTIQSYAWDFGDPTTNLDRSTLPNPAYIYPDSGRYTVRLIVAPNTVCADTFYRSVNVQYQSLLAGFTYTIPTCSDTANVRFSNLSRDSLVNIIGWQWSFGDGGRDSVISPIHTYSQSGTYNIQLIATAINGCKDTMRDSFSIQLPTATLADTSWICTGAAGITLNPNGNTSYTYNWSPSSFLSSANVASPFASPPPANAPMRYTVTVTTNNSGTICTYTRSTVVAYAPLFTLDIEGLAATCAPSVTLSAVTNSPITNNFSFIWSLSPTLSPVLSTANPAALTFTSPSNNLVYLQATNPQGCVLRDSHQVNISNYTITPNFNYSFLNCGGPTFVQFNDLTTDFSQGAITSWQWTATLNGVVMATSNLQNPILSFTQSGTYLVRLDIGTANQCGGSRQVFISMIVPSITNTDTVGICGGQSSLVLNPNGDTRFSYQWSPATNLSSTSAVSPTTNTNVSRTYYVTVTYFNSGIVCQGVDSVRVVIPPPLSVTVPSLSYYCGSTVQLTATPSRPVVSYQWSGDPSFFTILATGNPVTVTPTVFPTSGYYVRATDAYGCTASNFAIVQQLQGNINVQFSYNILNCGDSLRIQFVDNTIDTVGSRIISRQWFTSNNQSSNLANPIFTFTRSQSYTVRLVVNLANGCNGTQTQFININIPTLNGSPNAFVCAGATTANLNINPNPNLTYNWSPASSLNNSTAASPVATPPSLPFVYQVTVTAQNFGVSCSQVYAVTVQAAPPIVVDLPADTLVCEEPFVLVATTQNAVLLEWALNNSFNPVVVYNSNPVYVGFGNIPDVITIYARVRDAGGCIAVDSTTITRVVDTIPVNFGHNYLGCALPFGVQYTDSTQHNFPITSLNWTFSDGRSSYAQNPLLFYNFTGTYSATLTMRDARGCVGTATDTITLNLPQLTVVDSISICGGGVVELNPNGNENLTYNWSPNNNISSLTATNPSVTVTQNSRYIVTITAQNEGLSCTVVDTVTLGVGNLGLTVIADTSICSNTIALTANSATAVNYFWAIDNQFNFLLGTGSPFLTNINRSRQFFVAAVDAFGCVAIDSVSVNISQTPMLPNFRIASLYCADSLGLQFTDLTDSLDYSLASWLWTFGDGDSSRLQNPTHTYAQSGTYDVSLYVRATNGCDALTIRPINVQVIQTPNLADTIAFCVGQSVSLNPNGNAANRYFWNTQQAGLNNYNIANPTATTNTTTTYSGRILSVNTIDGQRDSCFVDIATTVIPSNLQVNLENIDLRCPSGRITQMGAQIFGDTAGVAYFWQTNTGIVSGANTDSIIFYLPADTAQIQLIVINANGCRDTAQTTLTVTYSTIPLDIFAAQDTIAAGDSIQLIATYNPDYSYIWDANPTLSSTNIFNPTARPTATDGTLYRLTATDLDGCIAVDTLIIWVQNPLCGEPYIFVPNAFTPDGDGLNDRVFVRGSEITDVEFAIYDRWGELVFQTSSQNTGWDGTFKGKNLPPDVYGYYLRCKCDDGTLFFKKGNVTLIR
jgi:gliding motility-associated-like protein